MKKMLRFDMCGNVEVPGDSPVGALYSSDHGRKVGEIVSQMEASDLPESGALHPPKACVSTVSAACRLSVRCAR